MKQLELRCRRCKTMTPHTQSSHKHGLHILFTLITMGLWLPLYLIVVCFPVKAQCSACGMRRGVRFNADDKWLLERERKAQAAA